MRIKELLESVQVPTYLYKWVEGNQFQKYIDSKKLPVKRGYAHYIESEGKMIPGNSFTDKEHIGRWTGDTLIRINASKISNKIYPIPGHKTFMRTKGMTSANYDPNAWKYESDDIDEYWIAGPLDLSSAEIVKPSEKNITENTDNKPTIGINVRSDGNTDYASLIVDGKKKYESRKTDSLRPYVGRTVGIVRTGNGPAVAIGQVTIGEPIVVDAEKFDKLRKQHLVPPRSLFDIGATDTKYLYPMINPVRWDEEKLIKNKGIVARKIEEQELTEFDYNKHVNMLNDYMNKLGYSYIGHGTDAHVFAKEEGPVIKVLIPENGDISTAKNPFLAFLNYCEKNANNPHLPKFIETTKQPIQLGVEKFDQVVMERLEELDPDYDEMIIDMMYSIDEGSPLDPQYRQYTNFYKTLKSVTATGTKLGFSNDIIAHDYSNVMQRDDTLVIADPWVSAGLK